MQPILLAPYRMPLACAGLEGATRSGLPWAVREERADAQGEIGGGQVDAALAPATRDETRREGGAIHIGFFGS